MQFQDIFKSINSLDFPCFVIFFQLQEMAGILRHKDNPVVFFDLHANKQKVGRVTFELFKDICPNTAQNFRQFCTGQYLWKGQPTGYKDTCLHKIIGEKFIQGGDFVTNGVNSRPKISIYGYEKLFEDESYELNHNQVGLLSSVNLGVKNGNGNLFRMTVGSCPELDGKSVVFGKVIEQNSLKVLKTLSSMSVHSDFRPKYPVVIKECGQM